VNTLKHLKTLKNRKPFSVYHGKLVVYKITNIISGKCYIGITSRIKRRIYEHIKYSEEESHKLACYLHRAIKKHGLENFIFEIIEICSDNKTLSKREEFFIKKFKSCNDSFGYNLTQGGERSIPNDITILKKIASSHKVGVAKYSLEGLLIKIYDSVMQASRENNIPDTDIHRCHRNLWSRNGFLYRKFKSEPLKTISSFESNRGKNLKTDGFQGKNSIKCQLISKKDNKIKFNANSILELSKICGIHTGQLHKIFNHSNHKKWKLVKLT